MSRLFLSLLAPTALVLVGAVPAMAQQTTGTPGSPNATTTIDGKYLPPTPPQFAGEINPNALQSKPWWPPRVVPPKGAPNVLLIMTDDAGFGAPSTFGGVIPTPASDRIAKMGLRYTTVPLHGPLLAHPGGPDHRPQPSLRRLRRRLGAVHRLSRLQQHHRKGLRDHRHDPARTTATARPGSARTTTRRAFMASQAGPFDQWPIGMGFEYFYGFVGGDTSQWQPNLFRNTTAIYPYVGQARMEPDTAMADDAIDCMKQLNAVRPDKPFFLLLRPRRHPRAASPDPGMDQEDHDMHLFDKGWNELREQIFANQKKLGVIPKDAKLTPWPGRAAQEWDTRSTPTRRSCSSARRTSTPPTWPTPTMRSAA